MSKVSAILHVEITIFINNDRFSSNEKSKYAKYYKYPHVNYAK